MPVRYGTLMAVARPPIPKQRAASSHGDGLKSIQYPGGHSGTIVDSLLGITHLGFGITKAKHDKDDHQRSGDDPEAIARPPWS
jgi:hypothetical protein